MKKKQLVVALILTSILVSCTPTYAQQSTSTAASGQQPASTAASKTFVPNTSGQASGFTLDVKLQNPLKVDNIKDAVKFFVDTLIKVAIPFIVIFFIWSGLKFILAQGNPTKVADAKKMFWYTIIGTLLILGAWTITNAVIGTVNSIIT